MSAEPRRPERRFTIRQLCDEFGVTARALRFYEDRGLLAPAREGLNRIYGARDHARLQLIVQGKRVGFSLTELREILDLYDGRDGGAVQMAHSLSKFRERIEALKAQRLDIDQSIHALEDGCERLETRLKAVRPDLLPQADGYAAVLGRGLDH